MRRKRKKGGKKRRRKSVIDDMELYRCDGCDSFDCAHLHLPSVLRRSIRGCPWCGSHCIERAATYQGRCRDCGMTSTMRAFVVPYPEYTLPVFLEREEGDKT